MNISNADRARILVHALPYIQKFNKKVIVVKYGGSAMVDEDLKKRVIEDVSLLKLVGFKPIIVHGGGKEISGMVKRLGMEPKFVNGLRVTDKETMEVAEMVSIFFTNSACASATAAFSSASVPSSAAGAGMIPSKYFLVIACVRLTRLPRLLARSIL